MEFNQINGSIGITVFGNTFFVVGCVGDSGLARQFPFFLPFVFPVDESPHCPPLISFFLSLSQHFQIENHSTVRKFNYFLCSSLRLREKAINVLLYRM